MSTIEETIARCHACDWINTTTPFQAAAQHLREEG